LMIAIMALMSAGPVWANALRPAICDDEEASEQQRVAAGCYVGENELENMIPRAVDVFLWIAGVLAVVMIIYAGLTMMMSAGDSSKYEKAKKTLIYAVVGLIVVILSYLIVRFVVREVLSSRGGGGTSESSEEEGGET